MLDIVRGWVDVLSQEDYTAVFEAIGLSIRSPEYYPEVEEFKVTDWRTAHGGNPEPEQRVEWYKPNSIKMAGAVSFDLPLNGRWSDLTAEFVFFENNDPAGYNLVLEEISSWVQDQRDIAALEPEQSGIEALEQEHFDAPFVTPQPSVSHYTSRFDVSGEELSQKPDEGAVLYNNDVSR